MAVAIVCIAGVAGDKAAGGLLSLPMPVVQDGEAVTQH
jgi:hypothetical protein